LIRATRRLGGGIPPALDVSRTRRPLPPRRSPDSVEDLEAELNDPRGERAGDLTVGGGGRGDGRDRHRASPRHCSSRPLGGADSARQIVIRVIEDVIELGAEFYLQALDGCRELFVQSQVGLVETRPAARVAAGMPKGLSTLPLPSLIGGSTKALG